MIPLAGENKRSQETPPKNHLPFLDRDEPTYFPVVTLFLRRYGNVPLLVQADENAMLRLHRALAQVKPESASQVKRRWQAARMALYEVVTDHEFD